MTLTELDWILRKAPPPPLECDLDLDKGQGCPRTVSYPLLLSVCLQHNSKTNDPKVFKLGIGNDLGIYSK